MVFINDIDVKPFYDIIIIGAGPGGLECAKTLNNSELNILVVEKNPKIGPKICAGGLIVDFNLNLGDIPYFSSNSYHIIRGNIDSLIKLKNDKLFKIISRTELGNFQLNRISNSKNISILTNTSVITITNSSITLENGSLINYNKLVGADGSNSIVRKFLNLETKIIMGLQYFIKDVKHSEIKFIFDIKNLDLGYIWVFPHVGGISVGVGFDPKLISVKNAKKLLLEFMDKNNIYLTLNTKLQAGPISYHYSGFEFNNIYLIGGAAGLTSYFSGEGIPNAIISGSEIGEKILDNSYPLPKLNRLINLKKSELNLLSKINDFPIGYKEYVLSKFWKI